MRISAPNARCALVASLLFLHAGLLAWGASRHSPAIDEVGHLPAGLSHWQLGRFDMYRVNPHLVRTVATLPVAVMCPKSDWSRLIESGYGKQLEFVIGKEFIVANGSRSFWYFTLARWACIPFSLVGACVCLLWARELYGFWAGILALVLWCFCPNILGNAQMISPDTGAAALGAAAGYAFWRWLRSPGWGNAALAGTVLGLAELTKSTWVILFELWPVVWAVWQLSRRRLASSPWRHHEAQLAFILFLGLYLINLGYGFEGSFEPLGNFDFVSEALASPKHPPPQRRNQFAGTWVGRIPVPLPRHYVLGIDDQKRDFETGFPSYLRGEWKKGGWWYYYLYALGIKLPLGTLILIFLTAFVPVCAIETSQPWRDEVVLLAPVAVILTLVSSQTGFNHHLRYVLPVFPFVFIWVSKIALLFSWTHWKITALACSALAWSMTSSLLVYPHSLSYFNELVGGPKGGPNHLVDSNIDWGQDLLFLKKWLDKHPEAQPLGLAYFGYFDPRVAGIEFRLAPGWPQPKGQNASVIQVSQSSVASGQSPLNGPNTSLTQEQLGPQPGWYAISVSTLRGLTFSLPDGNGGWAYAGDHQCYTYFQRFEPVAMAGYSIYIYHVTLEDANRVRKELGLPELACDETKETRK